MEILAHRAVKRSLNRIRELREARGWTQADLAKRIRREPATTANQVSRLETGERGLTQGWIQLIADALGCEPGNLLTPASAIASNGAAVETVSILGEIQAGVFKALDDLVWDDEKVFQIAIPSPAEYVGAKRFGLVVRDPSMNQRYLEGDILICVRVADIDVEPSIGSRVIVYRQRSDDEIEVTCKKIAEKNGKIWLVPESNDPEFQAPIKLDDVSGSTVSVHALVVGSYRSERPD